MKAHAVRRSEELLRELEDWTDLEPTTILLNSVMSSWVKSSNPAAVERTAEILHQMELSQNSKPDLISYNTHLRALALHSSARRPQLSRRAEEVLKRMEETYKSGELAFGPNLFSYNNVIGSICRSQDLNTTTRAIRWLQALIKHEFLNPDTFSFNQVLAAHAKISAPGSAAAAERLLRSMDAAYKSGVHPGAKPDVGSFTAVISAYTRTSGSRAVGRAQALFDEMKIRAAHGEDHLRPTIVVYNTLINLYAKSGQGTPAARKAEGLLREMQELFEAGDKSLKPNIVTWNAILNVWARSGTRCCGYQAEKYLSKMWEMYNTGAMTVKPNDFSYNTVIAAISKSKHKEKGQKALRMLRKMDKQYRAGNKEARPNEITYTAVISACAFPSAPDLRTRRKALDTALFTLRELQGSRYGHPNQVTYGTFIKACGNLLYDDDDLRRDIVKQVFLQCARDGQVGQMVLQYTPKKLYKELLAEYLNVDDEELVSVKDPPAEWSRNIRNNLINTSRRSKKLHPQKPT
jgi:Pentatricopeptide repeat domain